MDTCKVMSVIETTLTRRGDGTEPNPTRVIRQYWSTDGVLLAEVDPLTVPERSTACPYGPEFGNR